MKFPNLRAINPYADDEKAIRNLVITVQTVTLIVVAAIPFLVPELRVVTWALAGFLLLADLLAWRGLTWPGQVLTPAAGIIVTTIFMLQGNGIHDISAIALAWAIVVAALFLGEWGTIAYSVVVVVILVGMGWAEVSGAFKPYPVEHTLPQDIFIGASVLAIIGLSLYVTVSRLRTIAIKARENEAAQIETNRDLLQLKQTLEARVEERTADAERRASQLEAISKVARSISTVQELDRLLPSIAEVVSEQFGFYHTGIFLIDERSEFAVLAASNSEGGKRMLNRRHRLRIGTTGIVGYVAARGEPRIALDVGADATFFNNPDLPNTRSEIALPLKVAGDVIGVLDVQSTETGAFKSEDINVLNTLATQIAIAIENARLFDQTRRALAEAQSVYSEYIKKEWSQFGRQIGALGYTYDGIRAAPISPASKSEPQGLRIPVKIRGAVVGNITIHSSDPLRQWTQDELNLVQAAAERAGLAIENIRLLNEAQRRAAKERKISEISSRIGTSIDMNSILQSAVEELGRTMTGSEITIQLLSDGR